MPLDLDRCLSLLQQHGGRDKTVRTLYYTLLFVAGRTDNPRLLAMSKQLTAARLVIRQLNDLPMFNITIKHFALPPESNQDKLCYDLQSTVNLLYTLYGFVEHIAWLSDLKLLPFNSGKWFKYCLYIWIAALSCSIIRSLRMYICINRRRANYDLSEESKHILEAERDELLNLLVFTSDLLNAINFLPHKGFLWAQTFPVWKTGFVGFVASFAGLIKLYRAVKS